MRVRCGIVIRHGGHPCGAGSTTRFFGAIGALDVWSVNGCLETVPCRAGASRRRGLGVGEVLSRRPRHSRVMGNRLGPCRDRHDGKARRRQAIRRGSSRPADAGCRRAGLRCHHQRQALGDRHRPRQQFGHRQSIHGRPADRDPGRIRRSRSPRADVIARLDSGGRGDRRRPGEDRARRRRRREWTASRR